MVRTGDVENQLVSCVRNECSKFVHFKSVTRYRFVHFGDLFGKCQSSYLRTIPKKNTIGNIGKVSILRIMMTNKVTLSNGGGADNTRTKYFRSSLSWKRSLHKTRCEKYQ